MSVSSAILSRISAFTRGDLKASLNFCAETFSHKSLGNWKWYESDEGCFANKPTKFFFTIAVSNKSVLKSGRLQPSALYRAARFANFEGILVYF